MKFIERTRIIFIVIDICAIDIIRAVALFVVLHKIYDNKDTILMKKAAKISIAIITVLVVCIAVSVGFFFILISPNVNILGAPDLDIGKLTSYSRTVTMLDCDGDPIADVLYEKNKVYVSVDDLQPYTKNAFIAVEDKRFYEHGGIDYKRMASALLSNIKSRGFREGASTITQQLIKNTHLSNEKTLKRKINEMRLARKLERIYEKDDILESYLNILYFGSGIRGLGTASRVMFGKSASELTLAQSAALASIINNPTKYSPYNNAENLDKRKTLVLNLMRAQGFITDSEYADACSERLIFEKNKQNQFTAGLLKAACKQLGCTEKELFSESHTIKTGYSKSITDAVRAEIKNMHGFDGIIRVLILNNEKGDIACDETNSDKYINFRRSPASAIKPFLAYAPALENGMNPLSQINDVKTSFGDYAPKNYRDIYRGYQSLSDCLSYSSNIAAVKLADDIGLEKCKNIAARFGIHFAATDNTLPIVLGGMEQGVTLSELANAYRTLANGGKYSECSYVEEIDGSSVSNKRIKNNVQAVGDDTAFLLTEMLKNCAEAGTAKKLKTCGYIAAKTGTNGDDGGNRDCYCIAYTAKHTIAVWFGAHEGCTIDNSITGAACCNIIKNLCSKGVIPTDTDFEMPQSVAYYEADAKTLADTHEVYLADPMLPKKYRIRSPFAKRFLPIRKNIDIIDYMDEAYWNDPWDFYLHGDCFDIFDSVVD